MLSGLPNTRCQILAMVLKTLKFCEGLLTVLDQGTQPVLQDLLYKGCAEQQRQQDDLHET